MLVKPPVSQDVLSAQQLRINFGKSQRTLSPEINLYYYYQQRVNRMKFKIVKLWAHCVENDGVRVTASAIFLRWDKSGLIKCDMLHERARFNALNCHKPDLIASWI